MENDEIKYCVAAFIDLQGISSHLEVGRDLRTKIGGEIIERLNVLENVIQIIKTEKEKYPKYYNEEIQFLRFNDSIILTLDLHQYLIPKTGELVKTEYNFIEEWESSQKRGEIKEGASALEYFNFSFNNHYDPISKFVGLVSRIHIYVNEKENKKIFPGAKSVISTGFRKPFNEKNRNDFFSANFAISNAYKAEGLLKGPNLYIENNVLELISQNNYGRNICKFSQLHKETFQFDPFSEKIRGAIDNVFITKPSVELNLFHQPFLFRECNPIPLVYLQILKELFVFIEDSSYKFKRTDWFGALIKEIYEGININKGGSQQCESYILKFILGLNFPLEVLYLYIKEGDSNKVPKDIKID